jgi:hypothetical protein
VTTAVPAIPGCLVCNSSIGFGRHSTTIYCDATCQQRAASRRRRGQPISDRPVDGETASKDAKRRRVAESEALRLDTANLQLRKDLAEARRRNASHEVKSEQWASLAAQRKETLEVRLDEALWARQQLEDKAEVDSEELVALRAKIANMIAARATSLLWRGTGRTTQRILELWVIAARDMIARRQHTAPQDIFEWEEEMMHAYRLNRARDAAIRQRAATK